MVRKTFVVSVALAVAMVVAVCGPARAVSIWDGGGGNDNWTTGANWVGDIAPGTGPGVEVQFAGSTRLTPNVDTNNPWAVRKVVFNSGAGAFTVGGNEISLQGSGTVLQNSSSATQTFTSNLQVTGGGKTFTASSGHIVIDGNLDLQASVTARGGRNVTVNGLISGASGRAIGRTDSGTLKLTNPGNTFSGNPGISHGVLEIANIANSGVASAVGTGNAIRLGQGTWGPSDTGTLRYTGPTASTDRTIQMSSNGTTLPSATLPFSGRPTIDVTNAATTLTFNGDFVYSGSSTLGQWRLRGAGNGIINGDITTGGARLQKSGTGTWTLNGNNTYGGITEVLAGVLKITNASALGTTAAGTTVTSSAAQLRLSGGITVNEPLTISGSGTGSAPGNRGALRSHSGSNVWTGPITVVGSAWINASGAPLTLSGGVTGTNASLRLDQGSTTVTTNPINLGTGGALLVNSGSLLSVAGNTFGTLVVDWNGNFRMGVANALPAGVTVRMGSASANPSAGRGKLDLYGYDQTIGRLMDGGTNYASEVVTNSQATAATLTINQSATSTYQGKITGNLALTKSGGGTLTLTGNNTYTGATDILGGTLLVNGTHTGSGIGMYTVHSGATLGGAGSIDAAVLVESGGTLAPGGSINDFGIGGLTLDPTAMLHIEIDGALPTFDQLVVTGPATLAGGLDVEFLSPAPSCNWFPFLLAESISGEFAGLPDETVFRAPGSPLALQIHYFEDQVAIHVLPEPASLTLLGLGAIGLFLRRRRRR